MDKTWEFLATATMVVVAIWSLKVMLGQEKRTVGGCGCNGAPKKAMQPPVTKALTPSPGVNVSAAAGCGPKLGKKSIAAPAVA